MQYLFMSCTAYGQFESDSTQGTTLDIPWTLDLVVMEQNLTIDEEEMSYKCNQCEYASSEKRNLKRHFKIHKKVKVEQMQPM